MPWPGLGHAPIDQKFTTMSVMATMESNMATSTYWPMPVWSRWRRAASRPMVANRAVPMSPRAPTGEAVGGLARLGRL